MVSRSINKNKHLIIHLILISKILKSNLFYITLQLYLSYKREFVYIASPLSRYSLNIG